MKQLFASVIAEVGFGEYDGSSGDNGPAWIALLDDRTAITELVTWNIEDVPQFYTVFGIFDPDVLKANAAKTGEHQDRVQLVIGKRTTVSAPPEDEAQTVISDNSRGDGTDEDETAHDTTEAAADGGQADALKDLEGVHGKIATTLRDATEPLSLSELWGWSGVDPGEGRTALQRLAERNRRVIINDQGDEKTVELER